MANAGHVLILGMTESGKTTLAKELARIHARAGNGVLVLDPMHDPEWPQGPNCFQTHDPDAFLQAFWDNRQCAVFIDESGDAVGRYDKAMQQTATKGRHWGHRVHYITQRGAQISATVRAQCSQVFLFTSSRDDAKLYAKEFAKPELIEAATLGQGEYFHCGRYDPVSRGNIFEQVKA